MNGNDIVNAQKWPIFSYLSHFFSSFRRGWTFQDGHFVGPGPGETSSWARPLHLKKPHMMRENHWYSWVSKYFSQWFPLSVIIVSLSFQVSCSPKKWCIAAIPPNAQRRAGWHCTRWHAQKRSSQRTSRWRMVHFNISFSPKWRTPL